MFKIEKYDVSKPNVMHKKLRLMIYDFANHHCLC